MIRKGTEYFSNQFLSLSIAMNDEQELQLKIIKAVN